MKLNQERQTSVFSPDLEDLRNDSHHCQTSHLGACDPNLRSDHCQRTFRKTRLSPRDWCTDNTSPQNEHWRKAGHPSPVRKNCKEPWYGCDRANCSLTSSERGWRLHVPAGRMHLYSKHTWPKSLLSDARRLPYSSRNSLCVEYAVS